MTQQKQKTGLMDKVGDFVGEHPFVTGAIIGSLIIGANKSQPETNQPADQITTPVTQIDDSEKGRGGPVPPRP
jgi:hypothetical protein